MPKPSIARPTLPVIRFICASGSWPKPLPPMSFGRCAAHKPLLSHVFLERVQQAFGLLRWQMRNQRLDRAKLFVHETLHPVECGLKFLICAEVPRHGNYLSVPGYGQPELMEVNLTRKCSLC